MTIAELLRRSNNNADLLRLVAAIAVIWGHAYGLQPRSGYSEPVGAWLGFDYSGSLAVKFFFFLSGILVTNSLLTSQSALRFGLARGFRIFPALFASGIACFLVIGPLMTTLSPSEYFSNTGMYWHLVRHPYLDYVIPGVFQQNAYPSANGSLWTIVYELFLYCLLLGLWLAGLFRDKRVASIFLSLAAAGFFWRPQLIQELGLQNANDAGMLVSFFSLGGLLALHKDRIVVDARIVAGLAILTVVLRHGPLFQPLFYAVFLFGSLWLMSTRLIRSLRLPGDFSYGVYVYGWTIQQVVASEFPDHGPYFNQAVSIPAAILIGAVSWFAVEKWCIGIGHALVLWSGHWADLCAPSRRNASGASSLRSS
jgi:peptidoglycan/LPS O-acetylase OafA/YrhL